MVPGELLVLPLATRTILQKLPATVLGLGMTASHYIATISQVQAKPGKNCPFSCQGFLSGFMYLRPNYLTNAPRPPQILPQIQDSGQKSNVAAKMHKIVFFRAVIFSLTRTRSRTKIKAISSLELELELKIFS